MLVSHGWVIQLFSSAVLCWDSNARCARPLLRMVSRPGRQPGRGWSVQPAAVRHSAPVRGCVVYGSVKGCDLLCRSSCWCCCVAMRG